MLTKAEILERIEHLKQVKPDGWKGEVREWLRELAHMEDPFREHAYYGSEFKGRRSRPPNRSSYPLGLH